MTQMAPGANGLWLPDELQQIARTRVRKNSGAADVGARRRLNVIEGAGITATLADDPVNEEVAITLAAVNAAITGFAAPNIGLGTAAAAGVATTTIRSDATLLAFDATAPVNQAFGDVAAAGAATVTARRDHKHGMPASVVQANIAAGFRLNSVGASHPASPVAGDIDFDTTNKLLYIYNGTVWVCVTPVGAKIATAETRALTTYADLTTIGPAVTVNTATTAIVFLSCRSQNATLGTAAYMSFAVSGATTLAAADTNCATTPAAFANYFESTVAVVFLSGLTAGANTFTAKYRADGGTAKFGDRNITVLALPT